MTHIRRCVDRESTSGRQPSALPTAAPQPMNGWSGAVTLVIRISTSLCKLMFRRSANLRAASTIITSAVSSRCHVVPLLHAAKHGVRLVLIRMLEECVVDDSPGEVTRCADEAHGFHGEPPMVIGRPLACRYSRMALRLSSSILCPA